MTIDARVEEAYGLLSRPGGPGPEEALRARGLLRAWLDEEELADAAAEEDDPSTFADVPPPEVLNRR
jgi:hypothetical protein